MMTMMTMMTILLSKRSYVQYKYNILRQLHNTNTHTQPSLAQVPTQKAARSERKYGGP